jgi:hypothetical protein
MLYDFEDFVLGFLERCFDFFCTRVDDDEAVVEQGSY